MKRSCVLRISCCNLDSRKEYREKISEGVIFNLNSLVYDVKFNFSAACRRGRFNGSVTFLSSVEGCLCESISKHETSSDSSDRL